MNGELTLRPFAERDFEPLATLLARTWLPEHPGRPGELASKAELCDYLAKTTWSLVAERGGTLLGAALLAEKGRPALGAAWEERGAELAREAQADPACAEALRLEMGGVAEEAALADDYAATGAPEADVALKLLIVSPDAKGMGIGGRLFDAVHARLREIGAAGYHLLTDDSCDVSFYEHKGLMQEMSRSSEVEWPGQDADGDFKIYVYSERL